jgi:excisionase family DNA binding protein
MKPFLTPKQIAEFEHVHRLTVARWARDGKFAGTRKIGREYRIPIESYQEWKKTTKIEPMNERSDERTDVQDSQDH